MIGVYSVILGAAIVACALFLLKREFSKAYFLGHQQRERVDQVVNDFEAEDLLIDKLEGLITEVSESFYDISEDLEGKYSIHEKEIALLNEKIQLLEKRLIEQDQIIDQLKKNKDKPAVVIEKAFDLENRIDVQSDPQVMQAPLSVETDLVTSEDSSARDTNNDLENLQNNDVKDEIIALRSKGYSLKQIAKELNIGLGEIQLILNMKRS